MILRTKLKNNNIKGGNHSITAKSVGMRRFVTKQTIITQRLIFGLKFVKAGDKINKNCVKNAKEKELVTIPKQAASV